MSEYSRFVPALASLLVGSMMPLTFAAPELPPAAPQTGVTYEKDIRAIFQESCFRCHGAERVRGDVRLDSLEAALKSGEHGERVILPGDSARSELVLAVARVDEHSAMPPIRKPRPGGPPANGPVAKPLTPEQVGLIRAWIDQGAH